MVLAAVLVLGLVYACGSTKNPDAGSSEDTSSYEHHCEETEMAPLVNIVETDSLTIYYPDYSKIDLVCGKRPSKDDKSVIMIAEAAFTGELLYHLKHSNIAGDHVSSGKFENGYKCKRNTGGFVFYDGKPKFLYGTYAAEFRKAARKGGCAFAQEMMIHNGKPVKLKRSKSNRNEFRALCFIKGNLAIVDTKGNMAFGNFIKKLIDVGATEALYMDMGPGWNYSWYRKPKGKAVEIHRFPTKYATNWLTFYK